MARLLLLAFVCATGVSLALGSSWSYCSNCDNGPSNWTEKCASGTSQSPIKINSSASEYKSFSAWNLYNFGNTLSVNFTGTNNGHTLKISFPEFKYFVNGGGLSGNYTTAQFHLHWGTKDTQGSEHWLDDKQYAAEIHFVSFNVKYPNLTYAAQQSDGLAVLGVLIKVGNANSGYNKIIENAANLINDSSTVTIPAFSLSDLLPSNKTKYHRYDGSLTTPGCYESVHWTVFHDPIQISSAQIAALRKLKMNSTHIISDNFRPTQALNSRKVYVSFKVDTAGSGSTVTPGVPTNPDDDAAVSIKMTTGLLLSMLFAAILLN